jgi:arylsulfatase A-like enzyme
MKRLQQLTAAALVCCFAAEAFAAERPERLNVLMIAVDDLNHWVGYLGRNRQTITPNIDRLAASGTSFTRSYCAAPVCNSSRTALMSGLRPDATGVYGNNDDWRRVIDPDKPLTTAFRNAGYYVAGAGKIYHEAYKRPQEWDDYLQNAGQDPVPDGDKGVGGIRFGAVDANDEDLREWKIVQYGIDQLERKHEQPFFLAIGLHKPHMPWFVPQKYFDLHPLDQIELPPTQAGDLDDIPPAGVKMAKPQGDHRAMLESGRWKEAIQAYLASVSYADAMIGRLLDALENSPYRDNTIVVLWGDHGWHLGEKEHWRKFALWEEATRAPLIWRVPGLTTPGSVCERTVDFMSIYPTLTELTGVETPSHVEAKSMKPLLVDPQAAWPTPAVMTHEEGNHAVRSEGWRYIRYANGDEELYDETADPYEWKNLANDAKFAEQKAALAIHLPSTNKPDLSSGPDGNGKNNAGGGKNRNRKQQRKEQKLR